MFSRKKNWIVYAIHKDINGNKHSTTIRVFERTKKEAEDDMYEFLCWDKRGFQLGFRSVESVEAKPLYK